MSKMTVDELETALAAEPHLKPYIEVGDTDLAPARRRFETEQALARAVLRRSKVNIPIRHTEAGVLTTSFDLDRITVEHPQP